MTDNLALFTVGLLLSTLAMSATTAVIGPRQIDAAAVAAVSHARQETHATIVATTDAVRTGNAATDEVGFAWLPEPCSAIERHRARALPGPWLPGTGECPRDARFATRGDTAALSGSLPGR